MIFSENCYRNKKEIKRTCTDHPTFTEFTGGVSRSVAENKLKREREIKQNNCCLMQLKHACVTSVLQFTSTLNSNFPSTIVEREMQGQNDATTEEATSVPADRSV